MADNVVIDAMIGGDTVAADDIGGIKFQRIKLVIGDDGINDGDISATNPLPVELPTSVSTLLTDIETNTDTTATNTTAIAASASVLDDWDETNRAAVNTIAGQVGVQGGSGAVSALTQRVVLATDVALPTGSNAIGKLAANSGVDIGDVDVTTLGTITPGTAASSLGKAEDAAHSSGDVGVMALATANEANTVRAADNDYVPIATDTEGNVRIVGNRDHDAVDAGEVVGVGGVAIAHGTNPTAVAAADRTKWYFNRAGVPFVIGGHPNIVTIEAAYTAAQTDQAIITVSGGTKIVVTEIQIMADNANSVDVGVRVGFAAATTPTTTGVVLTHPGIPSGGGVNVGDGSGIVGVGADGEDLRITSEVPTSGSIRVLVKYFTIES